ncbi:hypothetical protein KXW56_009019 [Aspergillus fumigatus]|nr:hypothetical protein KXW52_006173 [Aspergillus fumigatus]KAH3282475.1 hypothetical protein KXW56_009019 [Aspergillus fumigatus]
MGPPPPLPIIADDDSTRDDGLLAQVALAQLLVEFQQAQTARPLGVKDRRVKQVELSLGYRMLQYRWNTSSEGPSTGCSILRVNPNNSSAIYWTNYDGQKSGSHMFEVLIGFTCPNPLAHFHYNVKNIGMK